VRPIGNDPSQNYAQEVNSPFDPCPSPLTAAAQGAYVVQGTANSKVPRFASSYLPAFGTPAASDFTQQACVGSKVSSYYWQIPESYQTFVTVYDQVQWQKAQSPRALDIYVNGVFQQRVHY
jgi:hypothetical protein